MAISMRDPAGISATAVKRSVDESASHVACKMRSARQCTPRSMCDWQDVAVTAVTLVWG